MRVIILCTYTGYALRVKAELVKGGDQDYESFNASPGWFEKFKKRYHISDSLQLHGESSSVNSELAESQMHEFRTKVAESGIPAERIDNADESAPLYNKLPNRMYLQKGQKVGGS